MNFNSTKLARRFQDVQKQLFPKGEFELSARENAGLHVYKNITNLVRKIPALPDGFPWNHPKNKGLVRNYAAGTLPQTDDILSRSLGTAVPGGIAPIMAPTSMDTTSNKPNSLFSPNSPISLDFSMISPLFQIRN